jgi:hypothetical protein
MNLASAPELLARVHCPNQRDEANEIWISAGIPKRSNSSGKTRSAPRDSKTSAISTPRFAPGFFRYPAIILQSAEVGVAKSDSKSVAYENRTKSAKCGGLETNGPREGNSSPDGLTAVRRFRANDRRYWRFQPGKIQRRKLLAEGLAQGEELYSNVLSQDFEAFC